MSKLFELAEEIIDGMGGDDFKKKWLKDYLSDPANLDGFMAELLKKELNESVKTNKTTKAPPKIK